VQQDLGGSDVISYSNCRVEARPFVIAMAEYHNRTCEGILPLDNDIYIHVGPATPEKAPLPLDRFQVYRVPKGTMVILRPGVWHHAPFTVDENPANVLIVLPERTYANDCVNVRLDEADHMEIVGR
jgi:ureidoglycolate lyase